MSMETGTKLGAYEIVEPIGKGGMGEVYRAKDTKLERDVAIKVLPEELSHDDERLARFAREAKLLAQLNHSNVATLFGFEDGYIIMEIVEGETLAERIARGPIPIEESVPLFIEIADGLEAAHAKDIIHRDLKPANIKIGLDGKPKILDFGLAKAFSPDHDVSAEASQSPTLTRGTALGAIMGTASYMSPEQAKGKLVDKRTDIWAFGCCLYEALGGRKAFDGETATDAIAAVVKSEPDWSSLPPQLPSRVRTLIERCLKKDARKRVHDIADARIELEECRLDDKEVTFEPPRARISLSDAVVGAAGLLVGLISALFVSGPHETSPPATIQFTIKAAPSVDILTSPSISRDGRRIVYTGVQGEVRRLFLRELDRLETVPLPGTEGAQISFFSPDGLWVGFIAGDEIRKVSVLGGESITVCQASSDGAGARWVTDDAIVFAPDWSSGLVQVAASGGEPGALTTVDPEAGEIGHWWPDVLPDERTVIFTIWRGGTLNDAKIGAVDLVTGERKTLLDGSRAHYAESGHLVFYRAGRYQAVTFDASQLEPTSEPVPVLATTRRESPVGAVQVLFDFSRNGTLISIPGEDRVDRSSLVWVDRSGKRDRLPVDDAAFNAARVSPDGAKIAATKIVDGNYNIWIYDLTRGLDERLTREANNIKPIWHPDSNEVAFASTRSGTFNIYRKGLGAAVPVKTIIESPLDLVPFAWSSDGSFVIATEQSTATGIDIWRVDVGAQSSREPLVQTPFGDLTPHLSPDSKWIAFSSTLSGRHEIYVQSAAGSGERVRVTTNGGVQPLWSPTTNELYFRNRDAAMAVRHETVEGRFVASVPTAMFTLPAEPVIFFDDQMSWDIAPDGERFLVLEASPGAAPRDEIHVTTNWFDELRELVPVKP